MKERLYSSHIALLVFMIQTGVAALSLSRKAAVYFGTNGWLSILILGCAAALNIVLIAMVNRIGNGISVFEIMDKSIPRFITIPIYFFLTAYFAIIGCLVGKQYIHIFQLIAFPSASPLMLKGCFDLLVLFLVTKGIYNIGKTATVFSMLILWMFFLLFAFSNDFELERMTPFVFKGGRNMLSGAVEMFAAFAGYELILFVMPYADRSKKWMRSVQIGNLMTTLTYLSLVFVSFGFFSLEQLKIMLYPLLDMLAYIQLPFVERLENLLFSFLLFTVVVTSSMYTWSACENAQNIFPKADRKVMSLFIVFVMFLISVIPDTLFELELWLKVVSYVEVALSFLFPIFLILLLLIQKRSGVKSHA
ncbi:GerAB/ArcD/ProY family transporter [Paenibacillus sp. HJL G12]|uniref:GerAB/ArcD/ProY family transporter n=1 Tax=Paenibacillus dendrobii TaxID=2691084 RepID=A0A7X3LH72_9BACL|nr:GerAB/ArcD/ProY family transporter [Paenibacillus dendrobii]MWV43253.1 GerAB/ArcD/ProY family transporter [Paenibacillus dendrobii]